MTTARQPCDSMAAIFLLTGADRHLAVEVLAQEALVVRGLQEGLLPNFPQNTACLLKYTACPQLHRLDVRSRHGAESRPRVQKARRGVHLTVPPVGQVAQLRDVVLRRSGGQLIGGQRRARDPQLSGRRPRKLVRPGLGPGLGLEEEVAAVDVCADVSVKPRRRSVRRRSP